MVEPIGLQTRVPEFDLGSMLAKVAQIQHAQTANALASLQLQQGQRQESALQDYQRRVAGGDPTAVSALAGFPQLHTQAIQAQSTQQTYHNEQNARAAERVANAGLEGSPERNAAWQSELAQAAKEGRIPTLMHQSLAAQPPTDQRLRGIINLATPLQNENPTYGVVGQDAFGIPQYGWIEPRHMRITQPTNAPQQSASREQLAGLAGPEFLTELEKQDKGTADQVRAILDGRAPYPSPNSRDPRAKMLQWMVSRADPNFDMVNFQARQRTRTDFTSGKAARDLTSFNTAIGHLDDLDKSIDKLGNLNIPGGSWARVLTNPIAAGLSPSTAAKFREFQIARNAVADELSRAFKGANISDTEVQEWKKVMNEADSTTALKAGVHEGIKLLRSRIDAVGDAYNRGMGTTRDPLELLTPKAQQVLKRLESGGPRVEKTDHGPLPKGADIPPAIMQHIDAINKGAATITLPSGKTLTADEFKRALRDKIERGEWRLPNG